MRSAVLSLRMWRQYRSRFGIDNMDSIANPGARVDLGVLESWMSANGIGQGPLERVRPVGGGTQNVMLRFYRGGREFVLRRGPWHLRPNSNDIVLREIKVLSALAGTNVPHPRLIASCPDPNILDGAVFYLMEPIDGFNAALELPSVHAGDPVVRHRMGRSIVDALAELGAVDHDAVGLTHFGKPAGFLERQVPRWLGELDSYAALYGYRGELPGVARIAQWLESRRPRNWRPGLMHGDYHFANVMFSRTGPEVVAIVDWEMCTVGDPLLDLGWLLATWQLPDAPSIFGGPFMLSSGLPRPEDLVTRYAARSSRDLSHMNWYTVLACFKLGILLEGTWARALAGQASLDLGEALHQTTLRLFERAENLMEKAT